MVALLIYLKRTMFANFWKHILVGEKNNVCQFIKNQNFPDWRRNVSTSFALFKTHGGKLLWTFAEMSGSAILNLASDVGPTRSMTGPPTLLVDLMMNSNFSEFYTQ